MFETHIVSTFILPELPVSSFAVNSRSGFSLRSQKSGLMECALACMSACLCVNATAGGLIYLTTKMDETAELITQCTHQYLGVITVLTGTDKRRKEKKREEKHDPLSSVVSQTKLTMLVWMV